MKPAEQSSHFSVFSVISGVSKHHLQASGQAVDPVSLCFTAGSTLWAAAGRRRPAFQARAAAWLRAGKPSLPALNSEGPRTAALCGEGASQRRDLGRLLSNLQLWTVQPSRRPPCPCPTRSQKHTLTETSGLRRPDCASYLFLC